MIAGLFPNSSRWRSIQFSVILSLPLINHLTSGFLCFVILEKPPGKTNSTHRSVYKSFFYWGNRSLRHTLVYQWQPTSKSKTGHTLSNRPFCFCYPVLLRPGNISLQYRRRHTIFPCINVQPVLYAPRRRLQTFL